MVTRCQMTDGKKQCSCGSLKQIDKEENLDVPKLKLSDIRWKLVNRRKIRPWREDLAQRTVNTEMSFFQCVLYRPIFTTARPSHLGEGILVFKASTIFIFSFLYFSPVTISSRVAVRRPFPLKISLTNLPFF